MTAAAPAYGLWSLVLINSLVFIIFAFSFAKPQSKRDWRSFGAFSAFIALFSEMYGTDIYRILDTKRAGRVFPLDLTRRDLYRRPLSCSRLGHRKNR